MRLLLAILLLLLMPDWFHRGTRTGINPGTVMTVFFTPLHTYYMSPTGSDAANGLTPGTAWATPNHPMVCGDVIIAATGSYAAPFGLPFGNVSGCPSTSGGIDGTGGIYFATLLCGGSDLEACTISSNQTGQDIVPIATNNWAVEGFKCNGNGVNRCFVANAPNQTTVIHHIAFINNIAYNTAMGFGMNDCPGGTCNHNVPGDGVDYWAVVGNIAQNAALDGICLAAVDAVGVSNSDAVAGTHITMYGNFVYNITSNGCLMDQEAMMFDTWDAHSFTGQGIIANNMIWSAVRYGIQLFFQNLHPGANSTPIMKIYNNTLYNDITNSRGDFADGEINLGSGDNTAIPYIMTIQNNVAYNTNATSVGGGAIYALVIGGSATHPSLTVGGTGTENILKGSETTCPANCDAGNNVIRFTANSFGTNFYVNPSYVNVSDLISNRSGVPNCAGFTNITACMGWNAKTQTLTTPSVISDLTATCAQCTGKGYQRPSITCGPNPDYPTWLKGIVYLRVSGANIIVDNDLVTKPCGM